MLLHLYIHWNYLILKIKQKKQSQMLKEIKDTKNEKNIQRISVYNFIHATCIQVLHFFKKTEILQRPLQ